jgi:hypothetical protein
MARTRAAVMDTPTAIAEVRAVYAELDQRPVERQCTLRTECCRFKQTGETPYLTAGEALLLVDALRKRGQNRIREGTDGACPLLDLKTGRCEAYGDRPFGCRTHFCAAAGGPYARREVVDLIRRLEDVDQAVGGGGAQRLGPALRAAFSAPNSSGRVKAQPMPRARGRG